MVLNKFCIIAKRGYDHFMKGNRAINKFNWLQLKEGFDNHIFISISHFY